MDDIKRALLGDHEAAKRVTGTRARLAWNTRAPILSAEEMEMLEGIG